MDVLYDLFSEKSPFMLRLSLLFIILFYSTFSIAGITLGATRVIYNGEKKEGTITISNTEKNRPYLVQSWVELPENPDAEVPFVVTPPLFRLQNESDSLIRVTYVGDTLPLDRESLFLLNINVIPAVEKKQVNRMLVATKSVVKLIYRPASLSVDEANNTINKISMSVSGNTLIINNPTPYIFNIGVLNVNGKNIERAGIVKPMSNLNVDAKSKIQSINIQGINDYGGLTESKSFQF